MGHRKPWGHRCRAQAHRQPSWAARPPLTMVASGIWGREAPGATKVPGGLSQVVSHLWLEEQSGQSANRALTASAPLSEPCPGCAFHQVTDKGLGARQPGTRTPPAASWLWPSLEETPSPFPVTISHRHGCVSFPAKNSVPPARRNSTRSPHPPQK